MNLYLTGMMGCGKSTLGRLLDGRGGQFVDLDAQIERFTGLSIPRIFEREGEAGFRRIESEVLNWFSGLRGLVVSTGGGIVTVARNVEVMRNTGVVCFVKRDIEDILKNLDVKGRPMLRGKAENARELYRKRMPAYEASADIIFCGKGSPERDADDLLAQLNSFLQSREAARARV